MSANEPHHFPEDPDPAAEPHDVLAAEEFPGPSPAEAIHEQREVELPPDPQGDQPHDVLAAEEFAMPAPRHGDTSVELTAPVQGSSRTPLLAGVAAAALGAAAVLLKRRAARRRSAPQRLLDRLPRP